MARGFPATTYLYILPENALAHTISRILFENLISYYGKLFQYGTLK